MALESFALLKWTTKGGLQREVGLKEKVRRRMRRGLPPTSEVCQRKDASFLVSGRLDISSSDKTPY